MPAMFAYFTLDGGRICTYSNGRYAGFFGLTPEQAVGMHLHDILGEDILAALEPYWRRVEAGEVVRYERSRREKDGREVHIDVWLQPQRDAGGAVIGVYAMVSDITERKETEIQFAPGRLGVRKQPGRRDDHRCRAQHHFRQQRLHAHHRLRRTR